MANADNLVGNADHDNSKYCFAKQGEVYLVYLPDGGEHSLDLRQVTGTFTVSWFNPRSGGQLISGQIAQAQGGAEVALGVPPGDIDQDWLVVIRKQ